MNHLKAAYGLREKDGIRRKFAERAGIGSRDISAKIMEILAISDTICLIYDRQDTKELIGD